MSGETLTLIMTFIGAPFIAGIIAILTWYMKKQPDSDVPDVAGVKLNMAVAMSEKIDKLEKETDELRDAMARLEERQESVMRELKSVSISIASVHKRLDALLVELATRKELK